MQFKDVIGQDTVKERLIRAAQSDRVPQAMLLLGKEGTGGLAMAMAFAQYLNCENPGEHDSCGVCSACRKASKIAHPDIHYSFPVIKKKSNEPPISDDWAAEWRTAVLENPYQNPYEWLQSIKAENKQGNVTVRECHQIIHKLNLKSFEGKYKVQIIWMPEYLGGAGNILLKIIEEPPENTVFLLVAENQDRILNTILSRTQIVKLPPIEDEIMAQAITERFEIPNQEASHLALVADGSFLAAMHLVRHDADEHAALFQQWLKNSFNRAYKQKRPLAGEMIELVNQFAGLGRENQKTFCRYGLFFLREVLAIKTMGTGRLPSDLLGFGEKVAKLISYDGLNEMSELLNNLHYFIERNGSPKIQMMSLSLKAERILAGKPVGSEGNF
jgi:DNA polymerase-3 subunit delta'